MNIEQKVSIAGEFCLDVIRHDGTEFSTGFFNNTITNVGLDNWIANDSAAVQYCGVGVGTTPAAATDTGITGQIGTRTALFDSATATLVSPTCTRTYEYRFSVSQVVGTITEVGIFNNSSGGVLFNRSLIKDPGTGNPTSITLLTGDTLYVKWRVSVTVNLSDLTGVVTADGVDYNYTARLSSYTASSISAQVINFANSFNSGTGSLIQPNNYVYSSQAIQPITGIPTGTNYNQSSRVLAAYVPGTFSRTCTVTWLPAQGNTGSGIGSARLGDWGYQIYFSAVSGGGTIPKDATKTFTITYTISVARA